MQSLSLFTLLLEIAPAIAGASPFVRFGDRPWIPARETGRSAPTTAGGGEGGGLSPAPTDAARHPDLGEIELFRRYQMGADTCGFASGYKSEPWTCFKVGAVCATTGSYLGCCEGSSPACFSTFLTTCIDYTAGQASSTTCGTGSLCCASTSPSCFTWEFSSSTDPGKTYTVFNCYQSPSVSIGTLLDAPPILTLTSAAASSTPDTSTTNLNPSTSSSSTTSSTSSASSTSTSAEPSSNSAASPPVGAIVGGVIGGLAVVGVVIVAIFWLLYRHRRQAGGSVAATGGATAQMHSQAPTAQQVPFYGQPVVPYHQYPPEQKPFDPHASVLQPQYSGVTDTAWSGSSPMSELGVHHPVGSQRHRAELG